MTTFALLTTALLSSHPADAVALSVADCGTLREADRPFQRYIWCPTWLGEQSPWAVSYAMNLAVSRSDVIQTPAIAANDRAGWLIRWDLQRLARDNAEHLAELHALWERLGETEPYFSIRESVKANEGGRQVTRIVAAPAAHTGLEQATLLRGLTKSAVPVVRADWFLKTILTTLDGGLYYEFADIDRSTDSDVTDQEKWLLKFGADQADSRRLRSEQRVAVFRSLVTGKPRRVDWIKARGGRDSDGRVYITHDAADGDLDAGQHPLRNLLRFDDRARETIALRNNSLQEFALFNDAGELQVSVPDDIARDSTIPAPYTARLEPALSCIRCHGPDDGYRPLINDVATLLDEGLDVFGDAESAQGYSETLDLLAAQYTGDPAKHLRRARDDYEEAVVRATNGRFTGGAQSSTAVVSAFVCQIVDGYRYRLVTADVALVELGHQVPQPSDEANESVVEFRRLLPPLPIDPATGISPEDPVIGALQAGLGVLRADWEQVYADAALRAQLSQPQPEPAVQQSRIQIEVPTP